MSVKLILKFHNRCQMAALMLLLDFIESGDPKNVYEDITEV